MRNLLALPPLALLASLPMLAACGRGGAAANNAAAPARYGIEQCNADMRQSYSPADLAMFCGCVDERNREGQSREQAIATCEQRHGFGAGAIPLDNRMPQ
jgi:hypothetical protein